MRSYKNRSTKVSVVLSLDLEKDSILQFYVTVNFPDYNTGFKNKASESETPKFQQYIFVALQCCRITLHQGH
jgi:hypothetical protein